MDDTGNCFRLSIWTFISESKSQTDLLLSQASFYTIKGWYIVSTGGLEEVMASQTQFHERRVRMVASNAISRDGNRG